MNVVGASPGSSLLLGVGAWGEAAPLMDSRTDKKLISTIQSITTMHKDGGIET
jgi:hypothetical protein